MSMASSHPRFVIGVLTPGADIMQIYSSLMMGGCSEISFVKDLNNSLISKGSTTDEKDGETKRRKRALVMDRSPSSPSSSACLPPSSSSSHSAPSPDSNLTLVLNGIVRDAHNQLQMKDVKEESPINSPACLFDDHSPSLPDAIESAPLLLSRVFGMGGHSQVERRESMMSSFDDDNDEQTPNQTENNGDEFGNGKRKGPVVECMKCTSKIIMQQTRSLFRHIMTHASQEPYKCSECLQSSANSFNLRTHIYRKHNGDAKIIPNRTLELEAEWRNLARECFPHQQERIDRCISYFVHSGNETLPLNTNDK